MAIEQVKFFANGVRAMLKRGPHETLRIFDKDGCMLAERKICTSRNSGDTFNCQLEKLTLRADKNGNPTKEYQCVAKDDNTGKVTVKGRSVCGLGEMFDIPKYFRTETWGLGRSELVYYEHRGEIKSDKTLWKMFQQWFDLSNPRSVPKPISNGSQKKLANLKPTDSIAY